MTITGKTAAAIVRAEADIKKEDVRPHKPFKIYGIMFSSHEEAYDVADIMEKRFGQKTYHLTHKDYSELNDDLTSATREVRKQKPLP